MKDIEHFCFGVGKYKVTVSYKNEKETFTYKVEDTTAPLITGAESIDIIQGSDLSSYDFKILYTVDDLSQTDVKYDTSAIDVNTIGTYTLKIISEDNYGNKSNKEAVINIVAPLNADGTTTKRVVTKKKTEAVNGDSRIVTSADTSKSSNNNSHSSSNSKPNNSTSNNNSSTTKPNNGDSSSNNSSTSGW